MSVIESLMVLYAKEISSGDRVVSAIRRYVAYPSYLCKLLLTFSIICRISGSNYQAPQGQSYEQGLLAWISHACAALKKRIVKELESSVPDEIVRRTFIPAKFAREILISIIFLAGYASADAGYTASA